VYHDWHCQSLLANVRLPTRNPVELNLLEKKPARPLHCEKTGHFDLEVTRIIAFSDFATDRMYSILIGNKVLLSRQV
jgi:hypothetical protein